MAVVLSFPIPASAVVIFFLRGFQTLFPVVSESEKCGKNTVFNVWECWWIRLRYVEYTEKRVVVVSLATQNASMIACQYC